MPANSTREQCTNKSEVHLWYQPCWSTKSFLSILSYSYLLYVLVADVQYCVVDRYVPCCRTLAGTGAEIPSVGQPQSGCQQMQDEYMAQMEAFAEYIALMVANTCVPMSSSSESSSTMMSLAEQQLVMALSLLNSAYFLYSFAMRVNLLLSTSMWGLLRYAWTAWTDPSSEWSSTTTTRQLVYSCLAMESRQLRYRRRNRVLRPVLTTHRDSCLVAQ